MGRVHRTLVGLVAGAAVVVLLCGLLVWALASGVLQVNDPPRREFPVRGIDVSNHQEPIDWQRVRRAGYTFAFIKATEGGDWTDKRYVEHTTGARAAGLRVGAYHFFTFCRDGAEQARHAVSVVRPMTRPGDLPLVVDLELGGNCPRVPPPAELDRQYAAFEAVVREAFGRPPILYVTGEMLDRYVDGAAARGSALAGHDLWIRNLVRRPGEPCERWTFWQFANRGRVDGVTGPVDLNVYCGDQAALDHRFGPVGVPEGSIDDAG